jgi:hypothetical protein
MCNITRQIDGSGNADPFSQRMYRMDVKDEFRNKGSNFVLGKDERVFDL